MHEFLERRIITGMIVSTDYLSRIERFYSFFVFESAELHQIADWCMEYFQKYKKAPDREIETLFLTALKKDKIPDRSSKYIEAILTGLSVDYGRQERFNSAYLYDKTIEYFKSLEIERHNEEVRDLIDAGKVKEAENLIKNFSPVIITETETGLDLSSKETLRRITRAFDKTTQTIIKYPGALGRLWNDQLIRGGFFTFLGAEKRGKSFMLIELSLRAVRQRCNVAFFSAGDMTEDQMLKRICIYIAQKSDNEKYCGERYIPVGDCVFNQIDSCDRADRNCNHGLFDISFQEYIDQEKSLVKYENLVEKYDGFPRYKPCDSLICSKRKGTVWLKKKEAVTPLTAKEARKRISKFFKRYKRNYKLITYAAGTLTVSEITNCLDKWEKYEGFVPDVIVIDYADLLSASDGEVKEFRHRQDHIWKKLRALSQERHSLVITATQADSGSYKKGSLSLDNFSEDKRKFAHVTAQYGLNQDPAGREKKLGIMRINEIVVREGEFSPSNEVRVLQDLSAGRPYLESF